MNYPSPSLSEDLITNALFMKTHKKPTVLNEKTTECEKCDFKTTTKNYLRYHTRTKHCETKIKCNNCDFSFSFPSHVRKHFKTVHLGIKRQDRKNSCKIDSCQSFGLSTCVELDKHSLLNCKQCQFSTIRNEEMRDHIQGFHEGIIYTCEQCGFVTKSKQMLRNHIKSKHMSRSLQCMEENCSFSTYSDKILRNHIEVKHEGRVRYKCENMNCDFGTNRKDSLKDHSFIHTGEKTHKCNQCNYTSYHEGNFKEHVKTHNKGKSTNVVSITLPRKRLKSNFSTNR